MHALSVKSRYQADLTLENQKAIKCILKYFRMIEDLLVVYKGSSLRVEGYTDSSFQSDVDDSKSNSVYMFTLNREAVCQKSSKQDTTTNSTIEVEYIAMTKAIKDGVQMKKLIIDLGVMPSNELSISLYYDNYRIITQMKKPRFHQKCSEEVPAYQRDCDPRRCSSRKSFIQR